MNEVRDYSCDYMHANHMYNYIYVLSVHVHVYIRMLYILVSVFLFKGCVSPVVILR